MQVTNNTAMPLPLAVWAVDDTYDYNPDKKYISVTSLLKPMRQIVLTKRQDFSSLVVDANDFVSAAMGTALHAGIEQAWLLRYKENMKKLGYPDSVIESIKLNPKKEEITEDTIPIYLEQRRTKEVKGWSIGGKFDFVGNGQLYDNKSTSVYKWITGSSDQDYVMQGSIYRWLNPDIITEDTIRINFIFTDWQKIEAKKNKDYPPARVACKDFPLLSIEETQKWLEHRITELERWMDVPESKLCECSAEELWKNPTKYKYFTSADSERAMKNFDTYLEAEVFKRSKGGKGVIKIVEGKPRRCDYCSVSNICSQYKRMTQN